MARNKPVQIFRKEPTVLEARIVTAAGSVGPRNVAQIARMIGAHQETVRYKMKKQFVDLGFRYQAEVDYQKLGLTLYWGSFEVSPVYYGSAPRFFRALNSTGFLIHFSKILPQGHFVALFSLPDGKRTEFARFLERMKERKIVTSFKLDEVRAERHKVMDPAFFNFQAGRWEVDWRKVKALPAAPLPVGNERPEQVADEIDMLIIKELQKDARQHIAGIAHKLKINNKILEYHYRTHVVDKKLVPGYRIRWMKDLTKMLTHSMMVTRMTFKGLKGTTWRKTQAAVSKIPYLWVEDLLKDGTYIATLSIPTEDYMGTIGYLNEELQFLGANLDLGFLKDNDSWNFTIPYHMFSDGAWRFDPKETETAILKELSGSL